MWKVGKPTGPASIAHTAKITKDARECRRLIAEHSRVKTSIERAERGMWRLPVGRAVVVGVVTHIGQLSIYGPQPGVSLIVRGALIDHAPLCVSDASGAAGMGNIGHSLAILLW